MTLEFLEECIQGFKASTIELKHLVLEYVPPWLSNLTRFCRHSDDNKRQKVSLILDKLITLTLQEEEMYPSIIAKIWGNLGQVRKSQKRTTNKMYGSSQILFSGVGFAGYDSRLVHQA